MIFIREVILKRGPKLTDNNPSEIYDMQTNFSWGDGAKNM